MPNLDSRIRRADWRRVAARASTLVAAACGRLVARRPAAPPAAAAARRTAGDVINLAFNADMQVPDPDIFYEIEGNSVMTSVYEGLVRYKPNSTEIEGALAARAGPSSPDGLTYTFKLRSRA